MRYYHIIAPLEDKFDSLEDATGYFENHPLIPRIPVHTAEGEERQTPRICVAPDLESCFTAIGVLGTFRRCLASNEDAFDYRTDGLEVYPILVCEFDNPSVYTPSDIQVPDVQLTGERWILYPVRPDRVSLHWLSPDSLRWSKRALARSNWVCNSIKFVEPGVLNKHPWLNGCGSFLDCSEEEPLWRDIDAEEYVIVYLDAGIVKCESDRRYTDVSSAFDDWVALCHVAPRRYIVPAFLLSESGMQHKATSNRLSQMRLE